MSYSFDGVFPFVRWALFARFPFTFGECFFFSFVSFVCALVGYLCAGPRTVSPNDKSICVQCALYLPVEI